MCGRYTLSAPDPAAVRARFPVGESVEIRRRFNVAPGDDVLAVTTDRDGRPRGEVLRWGLVPAWAPSADTGLRMINARVETAAERPAFRSALVRSRCLIVADGFYEWKRSPGSAKQAFHISRVEREPFAFAGLWSLWRGPGLPPLRTCAILTTASNSAFARLHDRMPVILPRAGEAEWLAPDTPLSRLGELVAGLAAEDTIVRAVGRAVNDARYDGPECLAAPEPAQAALF